MSHRVSVVLAAALVAVGFTPPAASDQRLVAPLRCGDTITVDTTLHRDVVGCPNNGIVIGADDVTLDLNGHRVEGDKAPFAGCGQGEFCDVGVLNDGHDGVTVRQGSVRGFALGVFVGRARDNRVLRISSSQNLFVGIGVVESARSVVRNSSGNRNGGDEGDGMFLLASHHVRVLHNSFRHNGQLGIHVGDSNRNLIKRNVIAHNPLALLMEGDRNQVRRNRIRHNDGNIIVAPGNANVVARNRISHSPAGPPGIAIENGSDNIVARNVIVDVTGPGIVLGLARPPFGGSHNLARRNLVMNSGDDGFKVEKKDDHGLLKNNVAIGARDDGFDVKGPRTTLRGNRAFRNGDLGIKATRRVIDGGGNIARDNGDPRQCTNITCTRRSQHG